MEKKLWIIAAAFALLFAACSNGGGGGGGGDGPGTTPVVTAVTITGGASTVSPGGTLNFTATVTGASLSDTDKAVTWSLDKTYATGTEINSAGKLAVAATETDKTVITVIATSVFDTSKSGTKTVTVSDSGSNIGGEEEPLIGIDVSRDNVSIARRETRDLSDLLIFDPPNAEDRSVTWKSSDIRYVTVTNAGVIRGEMVGSAVITVTSKSDESLTVDIDVTVNPAEGDELVTGIAVSPKTATIEVGGTESFSVSFTPATTNFKTYQWGTLSPADVETDRKVAAPYMNGASPMIKAVGPGTTKVYIRSLGSATVGSVFDVVDVTVKKAGYTVEAIPNWHFEWPVAQYRIPVRNINNPGGNASWPDGYTNDNPPPNYTDQFERARTAQTTTGKKAYVAIYVNIDMNLPGEGGSMTGFKPTTMFEWGRGWNEYVPPGTANKFRSVQLDSLGLNKDYDFVFRVECELDEFLSYEVLPTAPDYIKGRAVCGYNEWMMTLYWNMSPTSRVELWIPEN
jgi:uncharacterized protein YjdB